MFPENLNTSVSNLISREYIRMLPAMCFIIIKTRDKSIIPISILHAVWDFLATAMGA